MDEHKSGKVLLHQLLYVFEAFWKLNVWSVAKTTTKKKTNKKTPTLKPYPQPGPQP